jgi:hypothetical protein
MERPRAHLFGAVFLLAIARQAVAQDCPQLSGVFSATILGTTAGASADSAACGGSAAPEATVFYTAPRSGTYVVDTIGSAFDKSSTSAPAPPSCATTISIRRSCWHRASRSRSRRTNGHHRGRRFRQRERHVRAAYQRSCPARPRRSARSGQPAALSVSGTTATCASFLAGGESCADGGDNAPDAVFLYTAPFAGDFAIDTIGSGYDTQLAVRALSCTGPELACNDDIDPPTNNQSALSLALSLGETILIAVDGFDSASGPFTLNIRSTPATLTPTPTRTATTTHTASATRTASRSATSSRTATASRTGTRTRTPTRSATTTGTGTRRAA